MENDTIKIKIIMIPFESKLSNIPDIEERNKVFNSLSKLEQRREIAFDAANLVLDGIVGASKYCDYWNWGIMDLKQTKTEKGLEYKNEKDFQKSLLNDLGTQGRCDVCQRGLLMLSQIRLGNELSPRQDNIDCGSVENLKGFEYDNFLEMEEEFEKFGNISHTPHRKQSRQKLVNICCNIIVNGYFNKDDKTNYIALWNLKFKK